MCVGQVLARMELEIVLAALARRVAAIEPRGEPTWRLNNTMRAIERLPVELLSSLAGQLRGESVEKLDLRGVDLQARLVEIEPLGAVDLGELAPLSRLRRPLHLERVAAQRRGIGVAAYGPRVDDLAAALGAPGPSASAGPAAVKPVSSANSRRATASGSSSASISPFGIDQAPRSLRAKNGPPGWTSRTSTPFGVERCSRIPALVGRVLTDPEGYPDEASHGGRDMGKLLAAALSLAVLGAVACGKGGGEPRQCLAMGRRQGLRPVRRKPGRRSGRVPRQGRRIPMSAKAMARKRAPASADEPKIAKATATAPVGTVTLYVSSLFDNHTAPTVQALQEAGIAFKTIDVEKDEAAKEHLKELTHRMWPDKGDGYAAPMARARGGVLLRRRQGAGEGARGAPGLGPARAPDGDSVRLHHDELRLLEGADGGPGCARPALRRPRRGERRQRSWPPDGRDGERRRPGDDRERADHPRVLGRDGERDRRRLAPRARARRRRVLLQHAVRVVAGPLAPSASRELALDRGQPASRILLVMTTIHRVCPFCEATCGLAIEVEGGQIASVRGDKDDPFSRGFICPKAYGAEGAATTIPTGCAGRCGARRPAGRRSPGRRPTTRSASRLIAIREAHGNDAIGMYTGNPVVHDLGARALSAGAAARARDAEPCSTRRRSTRCRRSCRPA